MSKQTINLSTPNSGTGDPLRIAFSKVNNNFDELYAVLGLSEVDLDNYATKQYVDDQIPDVSTFVTVTDVPVTSAGSEGDKQGMVAFDDSYFYYCTADFDSSTIIWKRVAWSNDTW